MEVLVDLLREGAGEAGDGEEVFEGGALDPGDSSPLSAGCGNKSRRRVVNLKRKLRQISDPSGEVIPCEDQD